MRPSSTRSIYIVDRDAAACEMLSRTFVSLGYDVHVTPRATALTLHPPASACVLADVSVDDESALDLQRHFADGDQGIEVVFITGNGSVPLAVRAMKTGAVDFLTKPLRMAELLPAVESALDRSARRRDHARDTSAFGDRLRRLTPREREVLALILAGKRNREIAEMLESREATIKVHRTRLMRKLELHSLAELLRAGARYGQATGAQVLRTGRVPS